jgi:hypothetical protein
MRSTVRQSRGMMSVPKADNALQINGDKTEVRASMISSPYFEELKD